MTLQQIQYVVQLDNHRNFIKASEACFVSQPALTIQLKKLENEIGLKIFDRTITPLKPTKMGEVFIQKARDILQNVEELKHLVNEKTQSISGTFSVGIIPTIAPFLMPQFINSFTKHYKETQLNIFELQSEDIINMLKKGTIDIGILVTPLNDVSLREITLYHEPFVFYGGSNHKLMDKKTIKNKDIEKQKDLWLLNEGHCFRNQVLNICKNASNSKVNFQSGAIETIKKMVDKNGGFTLIPEMAVEELDEGKIISFESPKPVREVSLVTHKSFPKEKLIEVFRKEILNIIPKSFKKNEVYYKVHWR